MVVIVKGDIYKTVYRLSVCINDTFDCRLYVRKLKLSLVWIAFKELVLVLTVCSAFVLV